MNYGFVKIAASTPYIKVANCSYNAKSIIKDIIKAEKNNTMLITFPELCLTGYTCSDLFLQDSLLEDAKKALVFILNETKSLNITCIIGMPLEVASKLYNCAICFYKGDIIGIVPKEYIPNYNEFYEKRHFNTFNQNKIIKIIDIQLSNSPINFGKMIFNICNMPHMKFAIEICEDLWAVIPPSSIYATNGANIIINLSASNETTGKSSYRKELVKNQSARCICAYMYASAGDGESTTDLVFSGHNMIFENGLLLAETELFDNNIIYADVDLQRINNERRRNTSFLLNFAENIISYNATIPHFTLNRYIDCTPFIPNSEDAMDNRCKEILDIQSHSLKKRIQHIGIKNVILGVSGGLDSTQALIVANRTFELLGYDKKGIIAVTMPCFGTTSRTYNNAKKLCTELGITLLDIDITTSVLQHFNDIEHNPNEHNVTYENSQARERTQILMNLANKYNGIVIGTGDLSELALGFATYNGDHMSMYGVNSSIPKTLIKYLINYFAKMASPELQKVLLDILNTPVSPELLPPKGNDIAQITEDIVGPYELHDFFLYNMLRHNFEPEKIYYLSKIAFKNKYDESILLKWLEKFYVRFFSQQFKRSCMPDGIKVGSVSLSPRGDFRMPSDASVDEFLNRVHNMYASINIH